jgi:hypothetical protein
MNITDKVIMLVSMYMFLTMPDPMNPSKIILNIQVTSKSNMAANMATNMAPEHIRFIHKNVNNDI